MVRRISEGRGNHYLAVHLGERREEWMAAKNRKSRKRKGVKALMNKRMGLLKSPKKFFLRKQEEEEDRKNPN